MFGWRQDSFLAQQATRVAAPAFDAHAGMVHAATLDEVSFGMMQGTRIATQLGWRPVEAITEGDLVLTFDGGLQTVICVTRRAVSSHGGQTTVDDWPLMVPVGALGNEAPMTVLAGQMVLIESDAAEEAFGDPFTLLPAASLEGFHGIARVVPPARMEVVTLHFAQDEVVFAENGGLLHCPRTGDLVEAAMETSTHGYQTLSRDRAEMLVTLIEMEEAAQVAKTVPSAKDLVAA